MPNENKPLDVVIRETYAQTRVGFYLLKALQVEVQELRAEQAKLRSVVLTLLADPQAREDAIAVIEKFNQERSQ